MSEIIRDEETGELIDRKTYEERIYQRTQIKKLAPLIDYIAQNYSVEVKITPTPTGTVVTVTLVKKRAR